MPVSSRVRNCVVVAWAVALCCVYDLDARARAKPQAGKRSSALVRRGADDGRRTPLSLVHGIHGVPEGKPLRPINGYWGAFFRQLDRHGADVRERYAIYVFQYHTDRTPVSDIAEELGAWIDESLTDRPHVLVGHSMGGVVVKTYMASYRHRRGRWAGSPGGATTLGFISLGSPHHGTPAANDAEALKTYMPFGWFTVFTGGNYAYWWLNTGFYSPPFLKSTAPNRSDLRWSNFDGVIPDNALPGDDVNHWLARENRRFAEYRTKTIAYVAALRPLSLDLAPDAVWALVNERGRVINQHRSLEVGNEIMTRGLSNRFGATDGLVPERSAAHCDPPSRSARTGGRNYLCATPVRIRRFLPGTPGQREELPPGILSITRRLRGFDHLDLRDDAAVLRLVINDLRDFTARPAPPP